MRPTLRAKVSFTFKDVQALALQEGIVLSAPNADAFLRFHEATISHNLRVYGCEELQERVREWINGRENP